MQRRILSAGLLTLLYLGGAALLDAAVYNEAGGLVVMEMENTQSPLDQWIRINQGGTYYLNLRARKRLEGSPRTSATTAMLKWRTTSYVSRHKKTVKCPTIDLEA